MNLILGSFFYEKGISFNINYKVLKLIREYLILNIFNTMQNSLQEKYPKIDFFMIQISTKSNCESIDIGSPIFDKDSIEFFFEAFKQVLETCEIYINDEKINKIRDEVLEIVEKNDEYKFKEPDSSHGWSRSDN